MKRLQSRDVDEDPVVIFLHIPKTAGSTLNRIIGRQYSLENICSIYPGSATVPGGIVLSSASELTTLSEADQSRIHLLRTHMSFGIHKYLSAPATYFTLLRDPIERIISLYYFVSSLPEPLRPDYFPGDDMSLQDWIKKKVAIDVDNAQTRMLSGGLHAVPFGQCTEEDLRRAKQNLKNHFAVVGLTKRFDETLLLLKRTLGWQEALNYTRQNVTKKRPKRDDLPTESLAVISDANRLDIELYRYAENLFEEQIHQQGITFSVEVKVFQVKKRFRHLHSKLKTAFILPPGPKRPQAHIIVL
jgi:hypothetical protein